MLNDLISRGKIDVFFTSNISRSREALTLTEKAKRRDPAFIDQEFMKKYKNILQTC